jgi:uncharacterized protein (TIGR03437 family)
VESFTTLDTSEDLRNCLGPCRAAFALLRKSLTRLIAYSLWLPLLIPAARGDSCDFSIRAHKQNCTLTWHGLVREYVLYVPQNYTPGKSGIVLGLHGSQGSGQTFEGASITDTADREGFAVAFPSATDPPGNKGVWQFDGNAGGSTRLFPIPPDDMGFLRRLIGVLKDGINYDPNRVYVAGFSVGGTMAHRVGMELSDLVAAIGVDEGIFPDFDPPASQAPVAPVSVIMFHGTNSAFAICGNQSSVPYSSFAAQDSIFSYWTQANRCANTTANTFCTGLQGGLNASTTARYGLSCQNGTAVSHYELVGGDHEWYTQPMNNPAATPYNSSFGTPQPGITVNDILWNFFAAHPRAPAPVILAAIVNAAGYSQGPVSPGEIVTMTGSNIGPFSLTQAAIDPATGRIATVLAGARVLFDGVPAPLVYVSTTQVSAVVPYEITGKPITSVQAEFNGQTSAALPVPIVATTPALFSADASGRGQGAILNADGSYNSASNPAHPGDTVVLFGTGAGQTIPPGISGQIADTSLPKPALPISVTIGGMPVELSYYGAAPALIAGLFQINAQVPPGIPPGDQPVIVTVGSVQTQQNVTIAVVDTEGAEQPRPKKTK